MKRAGFAVVLLAAVVLTAFLAFSQTVRIVSFSEDGTLTWTNSFTTAADYEVFGSVSPTGVWVSVTPEVTGQQLPQSENSAQVSMTVTMLFFRVVASSSPTGGVGAGVWKAVDTNLMFYGGGSAEWFAQTEFSHDGVDAAQSGDIGDSQTTWFAVDLSGAGTISFWWATDSEPDADYVKFYVDDVMKFSRSGTMVAGELVWTNRSYSVGLGDHTFKWSYEKDSSLSYGDNDAAWVDQITFTPVEVIIYGGSDNLTFESDNEARLYVLEDSITNVFELFAKNNTTNSDWSVTDGPIAGEVTHEDGSATNQYFFYTPNENFTGTDQFDVRVLGDFGAEDFLTVYVDVTDSNDAPSFVEPQTSVTMDEDGAPQDFSLQLTAEDIDGDAITWYIKQQPSHGSASVPSGAGTVKSISYAPVTNWNSFLDGADSFVVAIRDPLLAESEITISVTVQQRNDAPVNTVPPDIAGAPIKVGDVAVAVAGSWMDAIDLEPTPEADLDRDYVWQRAASATSSNWVDIPAADGTNYELRVDDYDFYIRLKETVTDSGEGLPATQSAEAFSTTIIGPVGAPDASSIPTGSVWVTAGSGTIGDGNTNSPVRSVTIGSFYIDETEITKDEWDAVAAWGSTEAGYDISTNTGFGGITYNSTNGLWAEKGGDHPVIGVNWYNAVKWCNARSEMENRTAVYRDRPGTTRGAWRAHTIYENYGDVIFDVNNCVPGSDVAAWSAVTNQHPPYWYFTGTNYLRWDAADQSEEPPAAGILRYDIDIETEGTYGLMLRVFYAYSTNMAVFPSNPPACWIQVDGEEWMRAYDYDTWYRIGNGMVLPSSPAYSNWSYATTFEDSWGETYGNGQYYLDRGLHTVRIAGLSSGLSVDRVHFCIDLDVPWSPSSRLFTPEYAEDAPILSSMRDPSVYRAGNLDIKTTWVRWSSADGYRLPTESEWEVAARGWGTTNFVYPWGDTITSNDANYYFSGDAFETNGWQGTTPVGFYATNAAGLYDMAGNVEEWCFDWYTDTPVGGEDPPGPSTPVYEDEGVAERCLRGGSWYHQSKTNYVQLLRCGDRTSHREPSSASMATGFRTVRGY